MLYQWFLLQVQLLGACGTDKEKDKGTGSTGGTKEDTFSIAMVTDTGGVDDKSFNQSAWKGIQEYGKENNLEKGDGGFDYLQSKEDAEYATELNRLVRRDFDLSLRYWILVERCQLKTIADTTSGQQFRTC